MRRGLAEPATIQIATLLDDLIGAKQEGFGDDEPERLRSSQIYDQAKDRRPLNRQILGFRAWKNFVDEVTGTGEKIRKVRPISQ